MLIMNHLQINNTLFETSVNFKKYPWDQEPENISFGITERKKIPFFGL